MADENTGVTGATPPAAGSAIESLGKALLENFGAGGNIPPEALPTQTDINRSAARVRGDIRPGEPAATGATGAPPAAPGSTAATGATGSPPAAATGATGAPPAATGSTAATGATGSPPAATGSTAATGATGVTKEQLDAAESKMDIKTGTAFRIVRSDNDRLEGEVATLRSQLEAKETQIAKLSANQADSAEVQQLRQKVAEQDARLAVLDYQSTPEFQKIKTAADSAEKGIASIAASYNVPTRELNVALSESDPAKRRSLLGDLTKDFKPYDLVQFDRLIADRDVRLQEVGAAIASASETLKTQEAARLAAQRSQMETLTENWTKALDASLGTLSKEVPIVQPTGDPKWDADVKAAIGRVRQINIAQLPDGDIANRLYKSELLPLVLRLVTSLVGDNDAQAQELVKLRGGTPPAGGGSTPPPTPIAPAGEVKPDASFYSTMRDKLKDTGLPA